MHTAARKGSGNSRLSLSVPHDCAVCARRIQLDCIKGPSCVGTSTIVCVRCPACCAHLCAGSAEQCLWDVVGPAVCWWRCAASWLGCVCMDSWAGLSRVVWQQASPQLAVLAFLSTTHMVGAHLISYMQQEEEREVYGCQVCAPSTQGCLIWGGCWLICV
mgnify:CR=1 FL=1